MIEFCILYWSLAALILAFVFFDSKYACRIYDAGGRKISEVLRNDKQ